MILKHALTLPPPAGRTGRPLLPTEDRERLKADVFYWGFKRAQRGFPPTEEELEEEYDRRIRAADELYRARIAKRAERLPAARPARERNSRLVSRRNAIKVLGLAGVQAAAALGAVKLAGQAAAPAEAKPADAAATEEVDATTIDHVKLAAANGGRTVFAPFHGATTTPYPNHLDLLFPKPAEPAKKGRVREISLQVEEKTLDIAKGVKWAGWTFNGTIPGPVIRATEGDTLRVTLKNNSQHAHSIHFHGTHPANQDGVFELVPPGGERLYELVAEPFGVYPYHCHTEPLDQHVARGLYGAMIVDPPTPRPPAREMVMVMNGYDLNFDKSNELYSVNGMPGYYHENPIPLKVGELVRIYLINMTEFDPVNSLHLHANMFSYIPLGTSLTPSVVTDVVHLGIADRGILEFKYKFPGQYMFHAHQTELTVLGWKAMFNVS